MKPSDGKSPRNDGRVAAAAAPPSTTCSRRHNPDGGGGRELTYYPAFCHKASPTFFTWVKMGVAEVHRLKPRRGFEGQNLYFYNNHPIQFLCLAGIIVSRDEQIHRTILVLDDSTGATIEVVCDKPPQPMTSNPTSHQKVQAQPAPDQQPQEAQRKAQTSSIGERILAEEETGPTHLASATRSALDIARLEPGAVAKLKGTITRFRGMFQLHLERYVILPDTNAEVQFWEERTRFLVDVLCAPWVLSDEDIKRLKRECEDEEKRVMRRKVMKEKNMERSVRKAAQREEKARLRIERRYAREEALRQKLAADCAEASRGVGRKRKNG